MAPVGKCTWSALAAETFVAFSKPSMMAYRPSVSDLRDCIFFRIASISLLSWSPCLRRNWTHGEGEVALKKRKGRERAQNILVYLWISRHPPTPLTPTCSGGSPHNCHAWLFACMQDLTAPAQHVWTDDTCASMLYSVLHAQYSIPVP